MKTKTKTITRSALVNNLSKKEFKITYQLVNKFLKQFEAYPDEEKFWDKPMNLTELKTIRSKLERLMSNDA